MPVGSVDGSVLDGIAAVQHLAVTGIYAHMRDFRCIIGAFKEYQIARLRLFSADRRTDIIDALGGQATHVAYAGCGVHIADESGTVENRRMGWNRPIHTACRYIFLLLRRSPALCLRKSRAHCHKRVLFRWTNKNTGYTFPPDKKIRCADVDRWCFRCFPTVAIMSPVVTSCPALTWRLRQCAYKVL